MKTIDAKLPGYVDLFVKGNSTNHIIRRDFVEEYDQLKLGVSKRTIERHNFIKPIIDAGITFFKELGIHGYTIDYYLTKHIPKGYNLSSDEMLKAFTVYGLNEVMDTKLSHDELINIGNKMSINLDAYISNDSVFFNQEGIILDNNKKDNDIYYLLVKLPESFTREELVRYFMVDESLLMELSDLSRYEPLIYIKKVLKECNAKIISTNGYSDILVASFYDVHDRFKASQELSAYESKKISRGNGYSYLKCYR